ncbi:MAG: hypothetical protein GY793_06585 [Proteobacteria bacterium]|nr:hypothetical protein [Pseudomonadota bacterium]
MKEISAQIIKGLLVPHSDIDKEIISGYKENQIVRLKVSGTRKQRSLVQLKTYWAACRLLAENTENGKWNTMKKVDWQLRNRLRFYDMDLTLVFDGNVQFKVRSISFKNLKHIEACDYFTEAFSLMAKYLKIDVDKFMGEVKQRCGG